MQNYYKIAKVKIGFWLVETSSLYLHNARSTRHACIIVQHMHASYVTLSANHRNLFCLCAIMAEDLPCFNLGFQILNVEKDEKSDWQFDKISTKNSNARFVRAWVNKTKINFWRNHAKAKTTKSSTTWAVKVFKGMKKRKKTNYFVTNKRNHCELK